MEDIKCSFEHINRNESNHETVSIKLPFSGALPLALPYTTCLENFIQNVTCNIWTMRKANLRSSSYMHPPHTPPPPLSLSLSLSVSLIKLSGIRSLNQTKVIHLREISRKL